MSWLCLVMNLIFLRSNDVVIADGLMDDEIDSVTNFFVHVWASVFVRLKIGVSSYIPRSNFSGDGDTLFHRRENANFACLHREFFLGCKSRPHAMIRRVFFGSR